MCRFLTPVLSSRLPRNLPPAAFPVSEPRSQKRPCFWGLRPPFKVALKAKNKFATKNLAFESKFPSNSETARMARKMRRRHNFLPDCQRRPNLFPIADD